MNIFDPFAIIILSALIHASYQLSISVMTIMSGHALGKRTAHRRVTTMSLAYIFGVISMILLTISLILILLQNIFSLGIPGIVWGVTSGAAVGVGVAVWAFYYQHRQNGTILWIPRPIADYLSSRAKSTKIAPEAYALGLVSVISELIFSAIPLIMASLVIITLPVPIQLIAISVYALVATMPLLVIAALLGGGKSIAQVQRWREQNKRFLQFAAGSALIILGAYIYVDVVLSRALEGGII